MTAHDFAYWLQGFAELNDAPPSAEQWASILEHLQLVFTKVTPPVVIPQVFQGQDWMRNAQQDLLRAHSIC